MCSVKQITLRASMAASLLVLISAAPVQAAYKSSEPDWPCQSRYVPELSMGALWNGPALTGQEDWQADPVVAEVVERIAPRRTKIAEGEQAIADYAKSLGAKKKQKLPLLFSGLFQSVSDQRRKTMDQIKEFTRRQKALADKVSEITGQITAIPADAQGDASVKRAELMEQKTYAAKAFEGAERTVRYACEIPSDLEGRLGAYARAIEAALAK